MLRRFSIADLANGDLEMNVMAGRGNYKPGEGPKPAETYHAECPGELKQEGVDYPSVKYSQEICDEICERIGMGQTLRQISAVVGFPDRRQIYRWRLKYPEFLAAIDKADEMSDVATMDEIIEIADNAKFDYKRRLAYNGPNPGWELHGDAIARSRLMIDARKIKIGRSKRFGDKIQRVEHAGSDGGPIQILSSTVKFVDP